MSQTEEDRTPRSRRGSEGGTTPRTPYMEAEGDWGAEHDAKVPSHPLQATPLPLTSSSQLPGESVFERLADPSTFTGMYKSRFEPR